MNSSRLHRSAALFIACILAISTLGILSLNHSTAFAITQETEAELTETQRQIEDSAAAYNEAAAELEVLEAQIAENEARIAELENSLPEQQEKSDDAVIALYKMNLEGYSLVETLLGVDTLDEFLTTLEYITQIQHFNTEEVALLSTMKVEIEETLESLETSREQAKLEKENAETALKKAKKLRKAIQQKAEEEAASESMAAAEALAAARAAEASKADEQANNQKGNDKPSGNGISDVDWSDDKTDFVNKWAPRIDSYLSGSPMAGCGKAYAVAAWNYGVDPRFSPAISNTESSKGRHCFKPHNAWGWGQSSWGSWAEAIDAHVAGLARGYGYTITVEGAKKYCPPTWENWYSSTLSQMNMI